MTRKKIDEVFLKLKTVLSELELQENVAFQKMLDIENKLQSWKKELER